MYQNRKKVLQKVGISNLSIYVPMTEHWRRKPYSLGQSRAKWLSEKIKGGNSKLRHVCCVILSAPQMHCGATIQSFALRLR